MNVENMLHVRFEDCFPLSSGFQSSDRISLSFVHMFICSWWRILCSDRTSNATKGVRYVETEPGCLLISARLHLNPLQSWLSVSVALFFKKFRYPDSRIIILSVYQFSLYSFRDYLSTYKQLCIVAFLPQRNRSKICVFLHLSFSI